MHHLSVIVLVWWRRSSCTRQRFKGKQLLWQLKVHVIASHPPDIRAKISKRDSKCTKRYLLSNIQLHNLRLIKRQYPSQFPLLASSSLLTINRDRSFYLYKHRNLPKNEVLNNLRKAGPLHNESSSCLQAARTTNHPRRLNLNQTFWTIVKLLIRRFKPRPTGDRLYLAHARGAAGVSYHRISS